MIRKIASLLALMCVLLFTVGCENDEPSVTSCDNDGISESFLHYQQLVTNAVEQNDCEAILEANEDILEFIDNNYNCLIIYLVLTDTQITTDKEAETSLNEVRDLIMQWNYLCSVEESPSLTP